MDDDLGPMPAAFYFDDHMRFCRLARKDMIDSLEMISTCALSAGVTSMCRPENSNFISSPPENGAMG